MLVSDITGQSFSALLHGKKSYDRVHVKACASGEATGGKLCMHKKGLCSAVKYKSVQIDLFQNKKGNCSSGSDVSEEKSNTTTLIFRTFKPTSGLPRVVSLGCFICC